MKTFLHLNIKQYILYLIQYTKYTTFIAYSKGKQNTIQSYTYGITLKL